MRRAYLAVAVGLAALAGCNPAPSTGPKPVLPKPHAHPSKGPTGGPLVEWGEEEFHIEIVIDHATGEATALVLDESATKAVPIDAKSITVSVKDTPPVKVTLDAKPQDADPKGQSSRFVGKSDALKTAKEIEGDVSGTAGGKPYSGGFVHRPKK
jgi:hypothetical protein